MIKVLFVCLGNICRSPTAEGVFRSVVEQAGLSDQILVDSAGTGNWHIGSPPDRRAIDTAALRNIDLSILKARQVSKEDIAVFDYIIAMDNQNLLDLRSIADAEHHHKLNLFLTFADRYTELEVPDPYYGGNQGFSHVIDMIEAASNGLLHHIKQNND